MTDMQSERPAYPDPATATGRYVYAVCRGLDPSWIADTRGLDGQPLAFVEHGDLTAVVSDVPLETYGEEALPSHLEDLAWLEAVVRSHDAVVHAVASRAPTAPMRLATICFDDDGVRARLRDWAVDLGYVLDRVEGCAEWSVKVVTTPSTDATAAAADAAEKPASGADYLRRKKAAAQQRAAQDSAAAAAAQQVHVELAELARGTRLLPAQDPRLSGHVGLMVLNAAYLVAHADSGAFAERLASLRAANPDVVVDGRGPWPPYSFAMLDQR